MVIDHQKIILSRTGGGLSLRAIAGCVNAVFFWGVMLYMLRSLFLAARGSFNALLSGASADELFDESIAPRLFLHISLILAASFFLWAWARYNRRRYGGARDKRTVHPPAPTLSQLSEYTGFPAIKILQMRRAKALVAHFDEKHELAEMDCHETLPVDETEETEVEEVVDVEVAYCLPPRDSKRIILDVEAVEAS